MATLRYDLSRVALSIDLLIFVHSHMKTDIRSRILVCLVKMKIYHIFCVDSWYQKTLYTLQDIHQQIFLAKFHENLTLLGWDEGFFFQFFSLHLKMIQIYMDANDCKTVHAQENYH